MISFVILTIAALCVSVSGVRLLSRASITITEPGKFGVSYVDTVIGMSSVVIGIILFLEELLGILNRPTLVG